MGVQLNIKDATTVRLARELADASGTSVTATIRAALERVAADREAKIEAKMQRANAIVADFARNMPEDWKARTSTEIMDAIYDDAQEDGFAR